MRSRSWSRQAERHEGGAGAGAGQKGESDHDVVVVGGGVIGLSIAWRVAARGRSVVVADPEPGSQASYAAAGMLAPVTEATYGEEALLRLGLDSVERYPSFVQELEEASGVDTGFRTEGTLDVAFDADDVAVLDDLQRYQDSLGMHAERLGRRETRALEPMLAPSVRGGLYAADDRSIDPRRLCRALLAAAERVGAEIRRERVERLVVEHDEAAGVRLRGGHRLRAPQTVLAAGCWSDALDGIPPGVAPPVRPVKGQILRLRTDQTFVTHTVRGIVRGFSIYVVPRLDGEIVVGSTVEEMGFDTRVTAGGAWYLLRDAHELLPGVTELELAEIHAGLRPGSPDNAPVIGPTSLPGLVAATGHFRNGVLLTPVTADSVSELLVDGTVPAVLRPFSAQRFEHEDTHV
ncbi:MAG: glycine oxidase ThiO [Streptosporangiaceae bacterium]